MKEKAAWRGMRQRCTNPNLADYANYGGRGITVCDEWADFEVFLADMGAPFDGATLGRIDNDGNYNKSNCRWETREQQTNNRRNSRYIEHAGERLTVTQWARRLGIGTNVIYQRMKKGWPVPEILSESKTPWLKGVNTRTKY